MFRSLWWPMERAFSQGGAADTQSKMRPDVMIVEITTAEQYLHHDDNPGCRLTPVMPNGDPRSMTIAEGGYCPDTKLLGKAARKWSTT